MPGHLAVSMLVFQFGKPVPEHSTPSPASTIRRSSKLKGGVARVLTSQRAEGHSERLLWRCLERERETQGGLATEAMSSINCGTGGERLEESCCWGLSPPQKFPGGKALKCCPFRGLWVQRLCRCCRKAGTGNMQSI